MDYQATKKALSEGVKLTAITACAYLCTFMYEQGYALHFNIPIEYIEIDINRMITIGALIYFFGLCAASFSYLTLSYFEKKVKNIKKIMFLVPTIMVFVSIAAIGSYSVLKIDFWICFLFSMLTCFAAFAIGMLLKYFNILKVKKLSNAQPNKEDHPTRQIDSYLESYDISFVKLACLLVLPLLMFFAGTFNASSKTIFLMRSEVKNAVLLKKYGDTYIEGKYTPSNNQLSDTLIIYSLPDTPLVFASKKIGRLFPILKK